MHNNSSQCFLNALKAICMLRIVLYYYTIVLIFPSFVLNVRPTNKAQRHR